MSDDNIEQEARYRELQRWADRICSLVVASDYAAIDVVIEIRKLRDFAEQHFPEKMALFEGVYENRFRRLWEQFRSDAEEQLPEW